jgi:hypothetical protein
MKNILKVGNSARNIVTKAFCKAGNHRLFVNFGGGSAFIIHVHPGQPNEFGSTRIWIHNTPNLDSNCDEPTTNAEQLRHTENLPFYVPGNIE